jgi:hypothetical protein
MDHSDERRSRPENIIGAEFEVITPPRYATWCGRSSPA